MRLCMTIISYLISPTRGEVNEKLVFSGQRMGRIPDLLGLKRTMLNTRMKKLRMGGVKKK